MFQAPVLSHLHSNKHAWGPSSLPRTACLFTYRNNKYFWVFIITSIILWILSFPKLHTASWRWLLQPVVKKTHTQKTVVNMALLISLVSAVVIRGQAQCLSEVIPQSTELTGLCHLTSHCWRYQNKEHPLISHRTTETTRERRHTGKRNKADKRTNVFLYMWNVSLKPIFNTWTRPLLLSSLLFVRQKSDV